MKRTLALCVVGFVALALFVAGCSEMSNPVEEIEDRVAVTEKEKAPAGDHGHKAGQHGGTIVEIGRDNYHAEATFLSLIHI